MREARSNDCVTYRERPSGAIERKGVAWRRVGKRDCDLRGRCASCELEPLEGDPGGSAPLGECEGEFSVDLSDG